MIPILLKFLEAHPAQAVNILQSILDVLKADPALMAEVVAYFTKKPA